MLIRDAKPLWMRLPRSLSAPRLEMSRQRWSEAASLLSVGETRASAILSDLYNKYGLIKPVGAARGRGVRYTLAK